MAYLPGFDFEKCVPTEDDFQNILRGKKTGLRNYTIYGLDDYKYRYDYIRSYITAILLGWRELALYLQDLLLNHPYTKEELKEILHSTTDHNFALENLFKKYRPEAKEIEEPEIVTQRKRDARKGEITVKIKGNGNLLRLVPYSMKYGDNDPNKKQTGARMHVFFGKELGANKYDIVIRGSNLYASGKHGIYDQPYFKTEQEARDFIANFDHNHINTIVSIENWRWCITDAHIDNGYTRNDAGEMVKDWINPNAADAVKVDTPCGPAYMLKDLLDAWKKMIADEKAKRKGKKESMNEAIEKHDTLNPKLFDGMQLKPEVRKKAEEVVNEFLRILAEDEVKITVRDVILTGSNASYNYTKDSDVDLHILAKTVDLDDPEKLYSKLYNCYRRIFESKFDISFYGIPVEVYVETEDNPVISNGIYSVMYDKWVKEPQESYVPKIDQKAIDVAAKPWIDKANEIIKKVDDNMPDGEEEIDEYINNIYEMRQKGIYHSEGSEFSPENLTFKEVRNAGLLDKLKELKNKVIERRLSLDEGIKYLDDDHEFKDYGTAEITGESVIDTHKASTFATQDLLDGKIDSAYDNIVYDIIPLTPTQYFELCGKIQDMKPSDIIDFISADERQIAHIKDVILKYNKKLPLPFISFSDNEEVSGQEGRHRMYALGEMYGWDKDFPVMVIQDSANKKTVGELLNEAITKDFYLTEKDRRNYIIKISQLTHYQPIIQQNGLFEIYNIKENDLNLIMNALRRAPWVEYVQQSADRYDFSKVSYVGLPARYHKITGKIKI